MSNEEIFDIYDSRMNLLGQAPRRQVHESGLWHKTFHCWVASPPDDGSPCRLLFQLRHTSKDTYPDKLDTSCAGHLTAGETVEDGVRELEEELGLAVSPTELIFCGAAAEEDHLPNGWVDREFNHVYLYPCGKPLQEYSFQTEEISGLYWIDAAAFFSLLEGAAVTVHAEGYYLQEADGLLVPDRREVGRDDFALKSMEYYRLLFHSLKKLDFL